jgi:hypothetical protein
MALVLDVELVEHFVRVISNNFIVEGVPHALLVVKCKLFHILSELF